MIKMEITAADRRKYRYHTEDSIMGILYIQSLPTTILAGYAHDYGDLRAVMLAVMGDTTNPSWIMSQVLKELYERDVIGEEEYDDRVDEL